jgi:hypothetical protein
MKPATAVARLQVVLNAGVAVHEQLAAGAPELAGA